MLLSYVLLTLCTLCIVSCFCCRRLTLFSKLTFRVPNGLNLNQYQDRQSDLDPNSLQRVSAKKTFFKFLLLKLNMIVLCRFLGKL